MKSALIYVILYFFLIDSPKFVCDAFFFIVAHEEIKHLTDYVLLVVMYFLDQSHEGDIFP